MPWTSVSPETIDLASDLELMRNGRSKFLQNLVTNYSNFHNNLRKRINAVRLKMENTNIDYFAFTETKLDDSVGNAQFSLRDFKVGVRYETGNETGKKQV